MALVLLFWSNINDPYARLHVIYLSYFPLTMTVITTPLAFVAGVYVTAKVAWFSIFLLVLGSVALFGIWSLLLLIFLPLLGCTNPLIRLFTDPILFWLLAITKKNAAGSEIAGSEAASVRATQGHTLPPQHE